MQEPHTPIPLALQGATCRLVTDNYSKECQNVIMTLLPCVQVCNSIQPNQPTHLCPAPSILAKARSSIPILLFSPHRESHKTPGTINAGRSLCNAACSPPPRWGWEAAMGHFWNLVPTSHSMQSRAQQRSSAPTAPAEHPTPGAGCSTAWGWDLHLSSTRAQHPAIGALQQAAALARWGTSHNPWLAREGRRKKCWQMTEPLS